MPELSKKSSRLDYSLHPDKNPVYAGFKRCSWTLQDFNLVEAAGVEPASASTLPLALHA